MRPLALALAAALLLPLAAEANPKKKAVVERVEGPLFGCDEAQRTAALAAAKEARRRLALTKTVLSGQDVFASDVAREKRKEWARGHAATIFEKEVPAADALWMTLGAMETALSGAYAEGAFRPDLRCSDRSDDWCKSGAHPAHTGLNSPTIRLCPVFFETKDPARILIHESAHSAGVAEAGGERYCPVFDCATGCADEDGKNGGKVADAWAHFVHCVSNQPRDTGLRLGGR